MVALPGNARTPAAPRCAITAAGSGTDDADDVGLDERHVDRSGPPLGGRLGQHASAGVVVGQPIDPIERDQARRGEDADLPHGPAEPLALDPRLADEISRAGEQGPDRGAEPLRHAAGDGGGGRGSLRDLGVRGHRRVPEARAVEVDRQPDRGHRLESLERPARARRPHRGCPPRTPRPAPPTRRGRRPPTAAAPQDRSSRRRPRASPPARTRWFRPRPPPAPPGAVAVPRTRWRPTARARAARSGWPSSPTARTRPPPCPPARRTPPRGAATVGSSPNPSSPTSASAIALRIASVGRVTVSLRRSTRPWGSGTHRNLVSPCEQPRRPRRAQDPGGARRAGSGRAAASGAGPGTGGGEHEEHRHRHGDGDRPSLGGADHGTPAGRATRRRDPRRGGGRHRRDQRRAMGRRPARRHHELPLRVPWLQRVHRGGDRRAGDGRRRVRRRPRRALQRRPGTGCHPGWRADPTHRGRPTSPTRSSGPGSPTTRSGAASRRGCSSTCSPGCATSGARAPPPSTSARWRADASTRTTSGASRRGTWPPGA